jgi:hypothetical protein
MAKKKKIEQATVKEMFKRVISVAELLSKSDIEQKHPDHFRVIVAQKTQKHELDVS